MNLLRRTFSALRTWLGLADASDDHPTPSHGWLLPVPVVAVQLPKDGAPSPAQPRIQ